MLQYAILEDERLAHEEIRRMMGRLRPDYRLVGWACGVAEGRELLARGGIDLLLSDICLADGLCFELFDSLSDGVPVIFTTAYDEYALRAFKANGIDYLLKPVDEDELLTALQKFERGALVRTARPLMDAVRADYQVAAGWRERFLVRQGDAYLTVPTAEVAAFYSEDKYVFLHLFSGRRHIIDYTLDELEAMLSPRTFCRLSRGCIAHIRAVTKASRWFGGRLRMQLSPDLPHEIIVSRERTKVVLAWLDGAR